MKEYSQETLEANGISLERFRELALNIATANAVLAVARYRGEDVTEIESDYQDAVRAFDAEIAKLRAEREVLRRAAGTAYEVFIQERDNVPLAKRAVLPNGAIKILRAALAEMGE